MNFLEETREAIESSGHSPKDIIFIGSEQTNHQCSWEEFKQLADQEYDNDFGGSEVAEDLIFVFSDGTKLWRGEYDGSEWWEYSAPFESPEDKPRKEIKQLINHGGGWTTIEKMPEHKGKDLEVK